MIQIFGQIKPPEAIRRFFPSGEGGKIPGLITLLNNIIRLLVVIAGLYFLLNLILAGFQFMSAAGNPKNIEAAWGRIWQSLIGLLVIAGAFVLAAIFGYLLFGDATAILVPKIYGPR